YLPPILLSLSQSMISPLLEVVAPQLHHFLSSPIYTAPPLTSYMPLHVADRGQGEVDSRYHKQYQLPQGAFERQEKPIRDISSDNDSNTSRQPRQPQKRKLMSEDKVAKRPRS